MAVRLPTPRATAALYSPETFFNVTFLWFVVRKVKRRDDKISVDGLVCGHVARMLLARCPILLAHKQFILSCSECCRERVPCATLILHGLRRGEVTRSAAMYGSVFESRPDPSPAPSAGWDCIITRVLLCFRDTSYVTTG
jgi:hypothetical protein